MAYINGVPEEQTYKEHIIVDGKDIIQPMFKANYKIGDIVESSFGPKYEIIAVDKRENTVFYTAKEVQRIG